MIKNLISERYIKARNILLNQEEKKKPLPPKLQATLDSLPAVFKGLGEDADPIVMPVRIRGRMQMVIAIYYEDGLRTTIQCLESESHMLIQFLNDSSHLLELEEFKGSRTSLGTLAVGKEDA